MLLINYLVFFLISFNLSVWLNKNIRAETCQLFKKTKNLERYKNIMPCPFVFEGEHRVMLKLTHKVNEFEQLISGIF